MDLRCSIADSIEDFLGHLFVILVFDALEVDCPVCERTSVPANQEISHEV